MNDTIELWRAYQAGWYQSLEGWNGQITSASREDAEHKLWVLFNEYLQARET